jgi:uncharacterized membrane protein SirB2
MMAFYPQIKGVHVGMVIATASLFTLRGLCMMMGSTIGMLGPVRYTSYTIDTILFTSALMLATLLRQYPLVHGWLTVKVLLLIMYIVLGSYALKRGTTWRARAAAFAAALLTLCAIISVAHAHHPLGFFASSL